MLRRFASFAFCAMLAVTSAFADSHARIVRLSFVDGQVQIERPGQAVEKAILNTPIVEGTRIVTAPDGLAEIEFENQSTLRIAGDSEVKFAQLALSDNGNRSTQITLVKGVAYMQANKGEDSFRVIAAGRSIIVRRESVARFDLTATQLKVATLKGEIRVEDESQPFQMRKRETLTVDLKKPADYQVSRGVDEAPFDKWNKEREDYASTYADNQGYGGPEHGFGLEDLNYYGQFLYAADYGYVWQPYGFANIMSTWNPYSNGAWLYYPGAGYAWTSAYPWGWLPYHYGAWTFANGTGWVWVPGRYVGSWYSTGYIAIPAVVKAPEGWKPTPPPTVEANAASAPTVLVGSAGKGALTIPGGPVPPDFGSVAPNRASAATASHGHVFAEPSQRPTFGAPAPAGFDARASALRESEVMSPAHGGTTASANHGTAAAEHK